jgi:transcriptional regulator of acetoin/glycerol metabolism
MAHAFERAMLMCDDDRIDVCDLPQAITESAADITLSRSSALVKDRDRLGSAFDPHLRVSTTAGLLDEALKEAVERSLEAADGDCSRAAAMLGVSRAALYHKIVRFGLARPLSHHTVALRGDPWSRQDMHRAESRVPKT